MTYQKMFRIYSFNGKILKLWSEIAFNFFMNLKKLLSFSNIKFKCYLEVGIVAKEWPLTT